MPASVKSITGHRRQALTTGWELCSTPPDAHPSPEDLARAPLQWLPAHAPATAAACLRAANLWSLDAPARRFDAEDWWYRLRFSAPLRESHEELVLGFDGLATVADAWLNGVPLLSSDNMFLAHERVIDAPPSGANELIIRFRALDRLLEAKRPRPKWRAPMVENQQLRWFRTTLLGRTPGWSPPAAPVGPWRGVWLETRAAIRVPSLIVRSGVEGATGWVEVTATLESMAHGGAIADVALVVTRGADRRHSIALQQRTAGSVSPPRGAAPSATDSYTYGGRLEIPDVALWWPHTHGEPALHEARLEITVTPLMARKPGAASRPWPDRLPHHFSRHAGGGLRTLHQRRAGFLPWSLLDTCRPCQPGHPRRLPARRIGASAGRGHEHAACRRHDGLRKRYLSRVVRLQRHSPLAGLHVRQHGVSRIRRRLRRLRRSRSAPTAHPAGHAPLPDTPVWQQRRRATGGDVGCAPRKLVAPAVSRATRATVPGALPRGALLALERSRRLVSTRRQFRHHLILWSGSLSAAPGGCAPRGGPLRLRVPGIRQHPGRAHAGENAWRRRDPLSTTRPGKRAHHATWAPAGTSTTCATTT